jgi:hypothetical protein
MAVVFELVVNFGRDEEAVAAATRQLDRHHRSNSAIHRSASLLPA